MLLSHHPRLKDRFAVNKERLLIREAPDDISPEDVNEIQTAGDDVSPETAPEEGTTDEEEGAAIDDAEETPGEETTDPTGEEDPNLGADDPTGTDDPTTALGNDETRKLQLLNLFIQLKDIINNNIEIIKKLPFINSKNYTDTVNFVEDNLNQLMNNLTYLINYRYGTISYLDARKIFLNFKLNILQTVRIVNLLASYSKDNEIESINKIKAHKKKMTSIETFFRKDEKKKKR